MPVARRASVTIGNKQVCFKVDRAEEEEIICYTFPRNPSLTHLDRDYEA
jgi:hypothetical protein